MEFTHTDLDGDTVIFEPSGWLSVTPSCSLGTHSVILSPDAARRLAAALMEWADAE